MATNAIVPTEPDKPKRGRQKGALGKLQTALKRDSVQFFSERVMDNDTELKLWRFFMTGNEEGLLGDIEGVKLINPICWQAFKRAVEYKRGLPTAIVNDGTGEPVNVIVHNEGASDEFFESQCTILNLKTIKRVTTTMELERNEKVIDLPTDQV